MYTIEKNIPLPNAGAAYPFASMAVGDSFHLPKENWKKTTVSVTYYSRGHPGVKFSIRKNGEGYRCWRIA